MDRQWAVLCPDKCSLARKSARDMRRTCGASAGTDSVVTGMGDTNQAPVATSLRHTSRTRNEYSMFELNPVAPHDKTQRLVKDEQPCAVDQATAPASARAGLREGSKCAVLEFLAI